MPQYDYSDIQALADRHNAFFSTEETMADYTSFAIGGAADALLCVNSESLLIEAVTICMQRQIPFYLFGKGSNVLIGSKGLAGLVLIVSKDFSGIVREGTCLTALAGTSLSALCTAARDYGLAGLAFAYGIPGTVGGALYMNAGAYGGEMKDVVTSCRVLDLSDGENGVAIRRLPGEELHLSYRHSIFCEKRMVILDVTFDLQTGDSEEIAQTMNEIMQKRKEKQPLNYPSAGSTFKRPENDYASRLIDVCGLRGYRVGEAQVSEKHCGFVINRGGASFADVMGVIDGVKQTVQEKTGVLLECEVQIYSK